MKFAAVQLGETCGVRAGPIGLLTVACLKVTARAHLGRRTAGVPARDGFADGADCARARRNRRGAADSRRYRQPRVDCAIDCAARETPQLGHSSGAQCRPRVLTGIHSSAMVPFEVSPMRRKELAILNVRRRFTNRRRAGVAGAPHRVVRPLVTHTRPLERIAEAFAINAQYADGVGKMVMV